MQKNPEKGHLEGWGVSQGEKFEKANRAEAPACVSPIISTPRCSSADFLHTWKKTSAQG